MRFMVHCDRHKKICPLTLILNKIVTVLWGMKNGTLCDTLWCLLWSTMNLIMSDYWTCMVKEWFSLNEFGSKLSHWQTHWLCFFPTCKITPNHTLYARFFPWLRYVIAENSDWLRVMTSLLVLWRSPERFSNECRKTGTKVITLTNHNRSKQCDATSFPRSLFFPSFFLPLQRRQEERPWERVAMNQSQFHTMTSKRRENARTRCGWCCFCFSLV